ncbi:hypothetical protein VB834_14925 [Limnoraphis robusta Tam1]|uniref:hypothetical protein n=1 Tax=Limnoraphis robusta TaxID=1118279 RepID=UPI002B1FE47C|nr:hypothetical protein [Limnoraphis robusta]MEA5498292.1 hypothetical protein [Limnoraphis robusta BA-68 BA1]MEA5540316.1 hypothetical protein [Limnoraphis robusta Tam1]
MKSSIPKFKVKPGYKPQSLDTTPEVDLLGFELLKKRSPSQRLEMGAAMNKNARRFSISCFRQRFSQLSDAELAQKLALAWLGENDFPGLTSTQNQMNWIQDSIALAEKLHPIFESLNIPYYITGGVAAIAYGEVRTTRDVDIVMFIQPADIIVLAAELEQMGFYVPGVEDIIEGRMRILQVTDIETISRADIILANNDEFERIQFERRKQYETPGGIRVNLASPEDIILNKLQWRSSVQSDKQWRDILGILKVQGESLDFDYLNSWSNCLGFNEDLQQARIEAGL